MEDQKDDSNVSRKRKARKDRASSRTVKGAIKDGRNRDNTEGYDDPKRPLTAYNFFFRETRAELLRLTMCDYHPNSREKRVHKRTHGQMPFVTMTKTISTMWKELSSENRKKYQELADMDRRRYYNQKEHIPYNAKAKKRDPEFQPVTGHADTEGLYDSSKLADMDNNLFYNQKEHIPDDAKAKTRVIENTDQCRGWLKQKIFTTSPSQPIWTEDYIAIKRCIFLMLPILRRVLQNSDQ